MLRGGQVSANNEKVRKHEALLMREHFMMMCEHECFPFMPEMMFLLEEEELLFSLKLRSSRKLIETEPPVVNLPPPTPIVRQRNRPHRSVSQYLNSTIYQWVNFLSLPLAYKETVCVFKVERRA